MRDSYEWRETSYQVAAPVTFWWLCADGSIRVGEGVTRGISDRAVLVITKACPPVKALIQMTITLPGSENKGRGITLHGEGTVVHVGRVEPAAAPRASSEFAASVQFYSESQGVRDVSDPGAGGSILSTRRSVV